MSLLGRTVCPQIVVAHALSPTASEEGLLSRQMLLQMIANLGDLVRGLDIVLVFMFHFFEFEVQILLFDLDVGLLEVVQRKYLVFLELALEPFVLEFNFLEQYRGNFGELVNQRVIGVVRLVAFNQLLAVLGVVEHQLFQHLDGLQLLLVVFVELLFENQRLNQEQLIEEERDQLVELQASPFRLLLKTVEEEPDFNRELEPDHIHDDFHDIVQNDVDEFLLVVVIRESADLLTVVVN